MVMPSFSIVASFRPHIGSEVGGGTRFGVIPESQCALPAQHGIVSDDAFAIGNSGATNERATKKHRRHNAALESCLYFMNFFVTIIIDVKRSGTWQVLSGAECSFCAALTEATE